MRYASTRIVQGRSIFERSELAKLWWRDGSRSWARAALGLSSGLAVLRRDVLLVHDVKLLGHQRLQLAAIALQMIQHLGDRRLHVCKRLVPPAQRLRPHELPQPLDQVDIRGVRRDPRQVELRMPPQPSLDDGAAVIARPVHVEDEALGLRVQGPQQPEEVDELLAIDVVARQPVVDILVVVGAVGAEDVQALAPRAHAHQEPLPQQQPAAEHQVQAPHRVAGVDVVAPGPRGPWPLRLALVPRHPLDEGALLIGVPFPQEARHLVVADADALEQVLDPGGGIADGEGGLNPVADLVGVAEAARADLGFELLDLLRGKFAGVALVVDRAEGVEPFVAKDPEPFAQLGKPDAQQRGGLSSGLARANRQDRGEALVHPPIEGPLASPFDFLLLRRCQLNRLHRPLLIRTILLVARHSLTGSFYRLVFLRRRYIPSRSCRWPASTTRST